MVPELNTGGAEGADTVFETCALQARHRVTVHTFSGHRPVAPAAPQAPGQRSLYLLHPDATAALDDDCRVLAQRMQRAVGGAPFVRNLLRRNLQLAYRITSLYAVADFDPRAAATDPLRIAGGTAWACQAFADLAPADARGRIPLYLYTPREGHWWQFQTADTVEACTWVPLEAAAVPRPAGAYGGIGTRQLTPSAAAAIRQLYP